MQQGNSFGIAQTGIKDQQLQGVRAPSAGSFTKGTDWGKLAMGVGSLALQAGAGKAVGKATEGSSFFGSGKDLTAGTDAEFKASDAATGFDDAWAQNDLAGPSQAPDVRMQNSDGSTGVITDQQYRTRNLLEQQATDLNKSITPSYFESTRNWFGG